MHVEAIAATPQGKVRGRIMERLGVHTLSEAVLLAAAAGLAPFTGAPRPTDV